MQGGTGAPRCGRCPRHSRWPPWRGAAAATTQCILHWRGGGREGRQAPLSPPASGPVWGLRAPAAPPAPSEQRSGGMLCVISPPANLPPPPPLELCSRDQGRGWGGWVPWSPGPTPPAAVSAGRRAAATPPASPPPRHVCSALFGAALQRGFPRLLPLYSFMVFFSSLSLPFPFATLLAHTDGSPGPAAACLPAPLPDLHFLGGRGGCDRCVCKGSFFPLPFWSN